MRENERNRTRRPCTNNMKTLLYLAVLLLNVAVATAASNINTTGWVHAGGDVIVGDDLIVGDDVTITGDLTVTGAASFNSAAGWTNTSTMTSTLLNILVNTGHVNITGDNTSETLQVKAVAGQTQNLQEWQNSSGTAKAYVKSDGVIVAPTGTAAAPGLSFAANDDYGFYSVSGAYITISNAGTNYNAFSAASGNFMVRDGGVIGWSANPTGNAMTVGMMRSADGILHITDGSTTGNGSLIVGASAVGNVPLTVKAKVGQTANLTEWKNSSGTAKASVNASGSFFVGNDEVCTAANGLCNQSLSSYATTALVSSLGNWSGNSSTILAFQNRAAGWTNTSTQTYTNLIVNVSNTTTKTSLIFANTTNMRVGIKTAAPTSGYALDVNGAIIASGGGLATNYNFYAGGVANIVSSVSAAYYEPYTAGADIIFRNSSDTERMRITNAGLVGIGTTAPSVRLHLKDASAATEVLRLESATAAGASVAQDFYNSLTTGTGRYFAGRIYSVADGDSNYSNQNLRIAVPVGASSAAVDTMIFKAGKVGIIDISPDAQLDVQVGDAATVGLIVQGAASQSANLQEWQNSSGTAKASVNASGSFFVGNDEVCTAANGLCNQSLSSYATTALVSSLGNWSGNKTTYDNWISSLGNWSGNASSYATTALVSSLGNWSGNSSTILAFQNRAAGWSNTSAQTKTSLIMNVSNTTTKTSLIYADTDGMKVGIGTTAPGAMLQVNAGAAATKGVIVKGYASQSANLLEVQNSAGTILDAVSSAGRLDVGSAGGVKMAGANDEALNVYAWVSSVDNHADVSTATFTFSDGRATGTPSATGLQILSTSAHSGTATGGTNTGLYANVRQNSAQPLANLYGMNFYAPYATGAGTVSNGVGINVQSYVGATSTVTTLKGINIVDVSKASGGTVGTQYGIYINALTSATTNYAIYSAGGANVLNAGAAGVVPLTLKGHAGQTANLTEWQSSAGTKQASVNATGGVTLYTAGSCITMPGGGKLCGNTTCITLYSPDGGTKQEACN